MISALHAFPPPEALHLKSVPCAAVTLAHGHRPAALTRRSLKDEAHSPQAAPGSCWALGQNGGEGVGRPGSHAVFGRRGLAGPPAGPGAAGGGPPAGTSPRPVPAPQRPCASEHSTPCWAVTDVCPQKPQQRIGAFTLGSGGGGDQAAPERTPLSWYEDRTQLPCSRHRRPAPGPTTGLTGRRRRWPRVRSRRGQEGHARRLVDGATRAPCGRRCKHGASSTRS